MPRVAINGLGRIGRAALKILTDTPDFDLVAVNDIAPIDNLAYLLRFDSVYGRFGTDVRADGDSLLVGGHRVRALAERDPSKLPWSDLAVDLVFECTGALTRDEDLEKHIQAGARHVILSAPTKSESTPTVVHGVNRADGSSRIISCASCTTNCIAPVLEIARRRLNVERAIMTTVHAYTISQKLIDAPASRDFRRGRAAAVNLVPASTGAAIAATRAVPELGGRFDGLAIRAPIPVGSIADIVVVTGTPTTVEEVNRVFEEESHTDRYSGIVGASRDPLVSSDIVGDSRAAIVDLPLTRVVDGTLVKIMAWYDNEWGFTHQMIREARSAVGV
jgi:glyceraldehyde 3-phosphate dehydrogenase